MKTIPYTYFMLLFGIGVAICYLSRFLLDLIRRRRRKLLIALTAALLAVLICWGSPFLLDLPRLFTGELETVCGYVVNWDAAGREDVVESRGITIETETGEQVHLLVHYTPIHQGDYLVVNCLPHSGVGYVVQRNAECRITESKIEKTPYFWYDIGSKVFLF